ncbi:MAG: 4-(cytidine 5'-diphospho)-2-C-methyl-D-erythritol kinase [Chloroflexota bacterium]|nr:4-(cytidine 5'-diphospho)-2-C-methyl-D-erythritol kinase [Chloroflexota bacterium]MDE2886504.1 4-(cytidine 5'-diphospho)-2-C-methyl-D-erythritol kinase [Chloroflexota bacterium]
MLRLLAPAKVNLTFEVLGRRADGYHEVRTILQSLSLADELTFEESNHLSLTVAPEGAAPIEENLVLAAARLLQREAGVSVGAAFHLTKRIPTAGGLGGGSSDAATALLGLRQLWGLDLDADALRELAAQLGSDVPFFVSGGTALGEGRGERLSPLPSPLGEAVVAVPEASRPRDKTAQMYGLLRPEHYTDGSATADAGRRLRDGEPLGAQVVNAFDAVAAQAYPSYAGLSAAFESEGLWPVLCGAGPSMFALAVVGQGSDLAERVAERAACVALPVSFRGAWALDGVAAE